MTVPAPEPRAVAPSAIGRALAAGWCTWRAARRASLLYGAVFALTGILLLWGAQLLRLAPLTMVLAVGFLLLGPVLMAGLMGLREALLTGRAPGLRHLLGAWRDAPRALWALTLFCVLALFIWFTDAGILYSFMVGERVAGVAAVLPSSPALLRFQLFAAVLGTGLAAMVFAVTVHAVPLLVTGHRGLATAVVASVRAVFVSPATHGLWALSLAGALIASALVPPLLLLSLPLLGYAGHAFHREVFQAS